MCQLIILMGVQSTYYVLNKNLAFYNKSNKTKWNQNKVIKQDPQNLASSTGQVTSNLASSTGQVTATPSNFHVLPSDFPPLSQDLKNEIENIGKKTSVKRIKNLIKNLCAIHPLTIQEISNVLQRNSNYVKDVYLKEMIQSGELEYVFPHQPNHPKQAYKRKIVK